MNERARFWQKKIAEIAACTPRDIRIMEVCGSHSVAVAKYGIRNLLPENVTLSSGPGCPVCVSAPGFIDLAAELAKSREIELFTFGDLLRIPGESGTFLRSGKRVNIIYSPEEIIDFAVANPEREVVFAAVGFEPTLAAVAAFLDTARERGLKNLTVLADFKNLRPVLDDLAHDESAGKLNGFLLPGHVASVVGEVGFTGLELPGVIAGFEPEAIFSAIYRLIHLVVTERSEVVNSYNQVVSATGNEYAKKLIQKYFVTADGVWRGIGNVEHGVWKISDEFSFFDAVRRFGLTENYSDGKSAGDCRCGEILRGHLRPQNCPLFGVNCTPDHPVGACMVSEEGACMAEFYHSKRGAR